VACWCDGLAVGAAAGSTHGGRASHRADARRPARRCNPMTSCEGSRPGNQCSETAADASWARRVCLRPPSGHGWTMTRVLVVAGASSIGEEEAPGLAEVLRRAGATSVEFNPTSLRGRGVTWWQYVMIYVGAKAGDAIVTSLVESAVSWAEERVARRISEHGLGRPQSVQLYGPDGRIIKAVEVSPDGQVRDATDKWQGQKRRPPPSVDLSDAPWPTGRRVYRRFRSWVATTWARRSSRRRLRRDRRTRRREASRRQPGPRR
jgi:hypothetical protein